MQTRNGIYYNLKESSYKLKVDNLEFFFSSKKYLRKFYESYSNNREFLKSSLYNRWGFYVEANTLYDIVLYSKIEKRGFYLKMNGDEYSCLENVNLYLEKKIKQKSVEQLQTLTEK
jgi:hypothetical protein